MRYKTLDVRFSPLTMILILERVIKMAPVYLIHTKRLIGILSDGLL